MITVKGLSKTFGNTKAVNHISFEVKEKENLVILGTSGCGKTTTLKMINRLIEPDAGEITINGKNIRQENAETLRREIGYVMQHIGLFPHYTIAENIAVVPGLLKWDKKKTNDRIHELLEKLQLPESLLNQFPQQLSGGQMQRVGLARALVADPPVLLMDEPFGALDNVTKTSIQAEFNALEELKRKTIVMVTHDVQEAFELADRVCLMNKGEIIQIGTPVELLYKPVNDFARKFFDGQRLALELRVTSLHDLWNFLPENSLTTKYATSAKTKVGTMLEKFRNAEDDRITIAIEENQQHKSINFNDLMNAFNRFQKLNI